MKILKFLKLLSMFFFLFIQKFPMWEFRNFPISLVMFLFLRSKIQCKSYFYIFLRLGGEYPLLSLPLVEKFQIPGDFNFFSNDSEKSVQFSSDWLAYFLEKSWDLTKMLTLGKSGPLYEGLTNLDLCQSFGTWDTWCCDVILGSISRRVLIETSIRNQ